MADVSEIFSPVSEAQKGRRSPRRKGAGGLFIWKSRRAGGVPEVQRGKIYLIKAGLGKPFRKILLLRGSVTGVTNIFWPAGSLAGWCFIVFSVLQV